MSHEFVMAHTCKGDAYGYGVRLRPKDPVDPEVAYFGGVLVQCAFFSKRHQVKLALLLLLISFACYQHNKKKSDRDADLMGIGDRRFDG